MWATSSVRLANASVRNAKFIRSCLGQVLVKHYVILPPKLNPGTPRVTCLSLSRLYCTIDEKTDTRDHWLYVDREDSKYIFQKLSTRKNIQRLMECIGCSGKEAASMLKDCAPLRYIKSTEILRKINYLNKNGISTEVVLKNSWLLAFEDEETEEKLAALAELGVTNFNLAAPLLKFPLEQMKDTSTWSKEIAELGETKISILSSKLKCDPADIVLAVSVHKFIKILPFKRVVKVIDILLDEGVPPTKILRDMWVVRYREEKVMSRVKWARDGGIEQFKTWMVRCKEEILNNTIRIQAEKRSVLGPHNDSTVNYMSSRLKVSPEEAQSIIQRQPQLRGVGAAKLSNTFDFLLGKEGGDGKETSSDGVEDVTAKFNHIQVWQSSRILCHSLDTMKDRLARLRVLGYEPQNPAILYKTKKKFEEFVEKLKEKQALEARLKEEEDTLNLAPVKEASELSPTDANR